MGGVGRLAALLVAASVCCGGSALASSEIPAVGVAVSVAEPTTPTLQNFALGFSRIAEQLAAGHALNATFSVTPGYLPIADRGAAQALRALLSGAQIVYMQRGIDDQRDQRLALAQSSASVLTLEHSAHGGRHFWSSPQVLPQGIETSCDINLFAELLAQPLLAPAVFVAGPSTIEASGQSGAALSRLLDASGGATLMFTPEAAQSMFASLRNDPTLGLVLRAVLPDWKVTASATATRAFDEFGQWSEFSIETQIADAGGSTWQLTCAGSRGSGKRQYDHEIVITLFQNKSNTLKITGTVVVTAPEKTSMKQAFKVICQGKLDGSSVDIRLNGKATNDFLVEGATLVEEIDQDCTLYWKVKEPVLARLGFDEWKVTLDTSLTLRTSQPDSSGQSAPAALAGKASLVMARSGKDFLSADVSLDASTAPGQALEPSADAVVWEALGESERKQLEDMRKQALELITGAWLQGQDATSLESLWLK